MSDEPKMNLILKTFLIEQVANGWILSNHDPAFVATRCKGDFHVYRSIHELAAELPTLLADVCRKCGDYLPGQATGGLAICTCTDYDEIRVAVDP